MKSRNSKCIEKWNKAINWFHYSYPQAFASVAASSGNDDDRFVILTRCNNRSTVWYGVCEGYEHLAVIQSPKCLNGAFVCVNGKIRECTFQHVAKQLVETFECDTSLRSLSLHAVSYDEPMVRVQAKDELRFVPTVECGNRSACVSSNDVSLGKEICENIVEALLILSPYCFNILHYCESN